MNNKFLQKFTFFKSFISSIALVLVKYAGPAYFPFRRILHSNSLTQYDSIAIFIPFLSIMIGF